MQFSTSKLCERYNSEAVSKEIKAMKQHVVDQFIAPRKEDFSAISNYSNYSQARVTKGGNVFVKRKHVEKEHISAKKESSRLLGQERLIATADGAVQTMKET